MTDAVKDRSMELQKEMLAEHYRRLESAPDTGEPVVYTFVPGNLTELIRSFDALPVLPEINALQSAMRGKSQGYIAAAERAGHSEDVCSYVKCDLGMMKSGNVGPTGTRLPRPDLLLLSYTGCYTFMKWFELLREEYRCPTVFLHVPYRGDGRQTPEQRAYVARQIRKELIPALEKITGQRYDEERLRENLQRSAASEEDLVAVLESARLEPSPIDAYFGAVYYVGPIFSAFRGTPEGAAYYKALREEVEERANLGQGPATPSGRLDRQKYRLVVEGPPNWTHFRDFWRMFSDEGAVAVASTYSKVGGTYDFGFRHDPADPIGTMADYCNGCYTNLSLPERVAMLTRYAREYRADGFLIHSVKSCNSFSAGQLTILREVEKRTGIPGGFLESDLVDPRYFSPANLKNRLESYFQMLDARRSGSGQATG
jgi:benzoyl-CoA reductase subunit B